MPAPAPSAFLPVQLEIRTPIEPTAFPSAGRNYLIYELHLRNLSGEALDLQGIEVMDVGGRGKPLATSRRHVGYGRVCDSSRQAGRDQPMTIPHGRAFVFPPNTGIAITATDAITAPVQKVVEGPCTSHSQPARPLAASSPAPDSRLNTPNAVPR